MKLSSEKIEQTLVQIHTKAVALPEDHPDILKLHETFGDHTFFLDGDGLQIVEPTESNQSESEAGELVRVAAWDDTARTTLVPQQPEATGIIVVFESADPDEVDQAGEHSFPASDPTSHSGITDDDDE